MSEEPKFVSYRQGAVHPVLDEGALLAAFGDVDGSPLDAISVVGPRDYWGFRRYRERVVPREERALASPTDVFLWAEGIRAPACASRVGGVPHMDRATPWPVRDGVASVFWCQLSFADSRSVAPDTPGELLFIFRNPGVPEHMHAAFEFRWGDGVVDTPWTMADVPDGSCRMESLTGVRAPDEDYPSGGDARVVPAVKIGGLGLDLQEVGPVEPPAGTRFLAQVVSLLPRPGMEHPLIGRTEPLGRTAENMRRYNYCGSDSVLCMFMLADGSVQGRVSIT